MTTDLSVITFITIIKQATAATWTMIRLKWGHPGIYITSIR